MGARSGGSTLSLHSGHRQRVRNKYETFGSESMEDHQLLELLLFYAVPRGDVNPLAHRLINRFRSFDGVFDASLQELQKVPGVGEHTATLIRLVRRTMEVYQQSRSRRSDLVDSSWQAAERLAPCFFGLEEERVFLLSLDLRGRVLHVDRIGSGGFDSAAVRLQELVEIANRYQASTLVLAHNHPSGDPAPTEADILSTRTIKEQLALVKILLFDHIIFGGEDYISLRQNGLMDWTE